MKILVACEESQAVTIELRKLGHEAYSCDILPCSGGHTEWHIGERILKQTWAGPKGNEYLLVWLHSGNGKQKSFRVHRLVAEAFIPKVEGKDVVNHKDCDKGNNKVSNLEWCTSLENTRHAIKNGRFDKVIEKRRKPVLNVETGEVFRSIEEACQKYGVTRRSIYQVVNLEKRTSCGYHWRFV